MLAYTHLVLQSICLSKPDWSAGCDAPSPPPPPHPLFLSPPFLRGSGCSFACLIVCFACLCFVMGEGGGGCLSWVIFCCWRWDLLLLLLFFGVFFFFFFFCCLFVCFRLFVCLLVCFFVSSFASLLAVSSIRLAGSRMAQLDGLLLRSHPGEQDVQIPATSHSWLTHCFTGGWPARPMALWGQR